MGLDAAAEDILSRITAKINTLCIFLAEESEGGHQIASCSYIACPSPKTCADLTGCCSISDVSSGCVQRHAGADVLG